MDIVAAISVSKSLLELSQEIASVVRQATKSPDVTKRVLLYLEKARAAVAALGLERQRILTEVRRCDAGDPVQIDALWTRLDRYLHEDNVRPELESAIRGLTKSRTAIEKRSKAAWWRKRDKEAAAKEFSTTMHELESTLQGLTADFYPGGSGMGVQTLIPIFELVQRIRADGRARQLQAVELLAMNEELGELARQALRDSSHEDWFRVTGQVEALTVEIQLAFAMPAKEP